MSTLHTSARRACIHTKEGMHSQKSASSCALFFSYLLWFALVLAQIRYFQSVRKAAAHQALRGVQAKAGPFTMSTLYTSSEEGITSGPHRNPYPSDPSTALSSTTVSDNARSLDGRKKAGSEFSTGALSDIERLAHRRSGPASDAYPDADSGLDADHFMREIGLGLDLDSGSD